VISCSVRRRDSVGVGAYDGLMSDSGSSESDEPVRPARRAGSRKRAQAPDVAIPPVVAQDLLRVAEQLRQVVRVVPPVTWSAPVGNAAMQKLARQIANQGIAGQIQRMQGFSRPVIDPKFAELLSSNAFGRQIEDVNRSLKPAVESITKSLNASYFTGFEPLLEQTRRAVQELVRSFRQSLPSNWQELDSDALHRAIDLATESGLCLVWAPREEIVVELVAAADHEGRQAVLVDRQVDVFDDLDQVLAEATAFVAPVHEQARDLAGKAIAAARSGHHEAAQSLAAAALGLLLHEVLGYERIGAAYKDLSDRDVDEVVLRLLRMTMIELATARALTDTDAHESGFNRHGTLHGKPAFFSQSDCVAGLLLLGAWVRELTWWQDHHPEAITRA